MAAGDAAEGRGSCPHARVLPALAALPWEGRATSSRTGVQSSAHTSEGWSCTRAVLSSPSLPGQPFCGVEADGHPLLLLRTPPACSSLFLPLTKICQQPGLTPSFPKSWPATAGGGSDEALRPHTPRLQHPPAEGGQLSTPNLPLWGCQLVKRGWGRSGVCTDLGRLQAHQASSSLFKFHCGVLDFLSLSQHQIPKWLLTTRILVLPFDACSQ